MFLVLILISVGCNNGNFHSGIDHVEIREDSIRIETKYEGNNITKYVIDLKRTVRNHPDNEWVVNIEREIILPPASFSCTNEIPFLYEDVKFVFCKESLINFIKEDPKKVHLLKELQKEDFHSILLKKYMRDPLTFMQFIDYDIRLRNSNERIVKLFVDNYESRFGQGIEHLGITASQDTISLFDTRDAMKSSY